MSKETENLKLFKYDPETDDFNTTTFNIKQCLNNNWDKIDLYCEDTQKEITDLKEKDKIQDEEIQKILWQLQFCRLVRQDKDSNGIFRHIDYYTPSNKLVFQSYVSNANSEGLYQQQDIFIWYKDKNSKISFKLIYDADGDLIERRFIA
ncbi:hypothetical protein NPD5_3440 [Clostridium sporogenes]|uniref:Uncharacterized protein n=1 Tax=Clostridium sporogenes TaxID=1509 RepID=A0A1L3NBS3_CLOSG|nr:hypothetical protein [Clostridium sporogenes]APH13578.1 hypothetical protein NPD5_3440 [Clostridium sporogenes]